MTLLALRNTVQTYDWGSRTAIPTLQGRPPSAEPEAELWMGAHPKAASEVLWDGVWTPLDAVIRRAPEAVLGAAVRRSYGPRLPFLFKVLAAAKPLSIQAHPAVAQAVAGFERENAAGIPLDDDARNYRDRHHKPEVLCALTEFTVLRGFRPIAESAERLGRLGIDLPTGSWRELLTAFLAIEQGAPILAPIAELDPDDDDLVLRWARRLADAFPGDRGALAPFLLELVELAPGEAVFTGPGILHAYLQGVGIELMASSDNVLRGACTSKHVDAAELTRIVRFEATDDGRVVPERTDGVQRFLSPADEFLLSRLQVTPDRPHVRRGEQRLGVEILLATEGEGRLISDRGDARPYRHGDAFLVTGGEAAGYRIEGAATWFRAEVARCPEISTD
ncbi:MAG: mannose-6-phosphate isomerase, class I [Acidobacteriota bacterium]